MPSPDRSPSPRRPGSPSDLVTPNDADPSPLPPVPVLSPLLTRRLNARVLDPETAVLAPDQPKPLPTVYVSDTLLVRDVTGADADDAGGPRSRVEELADYAGRLPEPLTIDVMGDPVLVPYRGDAPEDMGPDGRVTVTRVRLGRHPERAGKAPDAWRFLQGALSEPSERAALLHDKLGVGRLDDDPSADEDERRRRERRHRRARSMAGGVSVEHVLTAGGGIWGGGGGIWGGGGGIWGGGGGIWGGGGGQLSQYGVPGIGGRTPVMLATPDPRAHVQPAADAPVVAVLDTGLGRHPWFPDEPRGSAAEDCVAPCPGAHRRVTHDGELVGLWREPSRDPENTGVVIDDVNGLIDPLCGHGTFIAGIVRQRCPEAVILSVPVMASDGAALEDDVVEALSRLLERHRAAKAAPGTITHGVLDVVNVSLGYYHESPTDADDTALHDLLREFADEGVVVVACAGNDATRARFFPAAFSQAGRLDVIGVGATNPDDRSVALFTNVGDWVTAHAPGAGVVSSVPTTLSGSLTPSVVVHGDGPGHRSGVDFDDFRSGFAVWSGTSFAAPWVAGEIAARVVRTERAPAATDGAGSRAQVAAAAVVREGNAARFGHDDG